jgi:IS4 transposase
LNLVCRDLTGNGDTITAIYQKRWQVEVFHQSLKASAALAKSPTRRVAAKQACVSID